MTIIVQIYLSSIIDLTVAFTKCIVIYYV